MLSKHARFPADLKRVQDGTFSIKEFIKATAKAYEMPVSKEDRKRQRDDALFEAYASVPRPVLLKLSKILQDDCNLFNYSCDIERFLNRSVSPFYLDLNVY
jgi:hypothetical protein